MNESTFLSGRVLCALLLFSPALTGCVQAQESPGTQTAIPTIEKMPNLPRPYVLRDWKEVARGFDRFVFDFDRKGDHLPLPWWDNSRVNLDLTGFALPAYVGDFRQTAQHNNYDAITCLGSVLGATVTGIDKSRRDGKDWVGMLKIYYVSKDGTNLYLNNPTARTGQSFWYELLPSLLFYQIYDHYRDEPEMKAQMLGIADRWQQGCLDLAGAGRTPDFDHTAFNFNTGQPFDNPRWKEPDAAAAVAWLEYMAFVQTSDKKYFNAADSALRFLDERAVNPFYECLMPYGAYVSARMNAEQGTTHDTEKLINWVFDGSNPRKWGVITGSWNDTPIDGLLGSVYPKSEYAFAMNSFLSPAVMVPLVRYDPRFARAMGKWVLNVAVNSRYFYAQAWKPEQQTSWEWASKNDPESVLAYEGIRKNGLHRDHPVDEKAISGSVGGRKGNDERNHREKISPDARGAFNVVWKFDPPAGKKQTLVIEFGKDGTAGQALTISASDGESGPWTPIATVKPGNVARKAVEVQGNKTVYFSLSNTPSDAARPLALEDIYVNTELELSPQVGGDPTYLGWGSTDIGLYGGCFVGMLGALVEPTDVAGIIRIDCRATESFAPPGYPTYLYYNPHPDERAVKVPVGDSPVDLYDMVSRRWLAKGVTGEPSIHLPADSAAVLVLCPNGKPLTRQGRQLLCDGKVIDYNAGP